MAITVEKYGTLQKKKCFGCGSLISFENDDIKRLPKGGTFVVCPVCNKKIKANPIDWEHPSKPKSVGNVGKALQDANVMVEDEDAERLAEEMAKEEAETDWDGE